jgi:hypothetical protein
MTDRELMELAAKAAGVVIIRSRLDDPMCADMLIEAGPIVSDQRLIGWNPLTDDGDALRLAVQLDLHVLRFGNMTTAKVCTSLDAFDERDDGNDPYAATRRAIVRAAAEIGKNTELFIPTDQDMSSEDHGFIVACEVEDIVTARLAAAHESTAQSLGLYAVQADAILEVLDKYAPKTTGNLQTRISQVCERLAAQVPVPDGWLLVPTEPTIAMSENGSIASDYDLSQTRAGEVYRAMLAAHEVDAAIKQSAAPTYP